MDIAINEGKIVQVAKNINAKQAIQAVNAKGLLVTPGLIDIHSHNFLVLSPIISMKMETLHFPRMVLLFVTELLQ